MTHLSFLDRTGKQTNLIHRRYSLLFYHPTSSLPAQPTHRYLWFPLVAYHSFYGCHPYCGIIRLVHHHFTYRLHFFIFSHASYRRRFHLITHSPTSNAYCMSACGAGGGACSGSAEACGTGASIGNCGTSTATTGTAAFVPGTGLSTGSISRPHDPEAWARRKAKLKRNKQKLKRNKERLKLKLRVLKATLKGKKIASVA
ncbi:hypothetical protein BU26DRAFT_189288 [Trematosphaeria pertusa]|uniref:Uncharacterized protein n=1 Tax=Trematosphaeria pertusa TaxID=390896 RepID=A0A6A6HRJ5_9PLEO|nr:uncharacterized protein BU26DRAFT_189288 [Trematosphaeria pertusa]KAF2240775.1 hypothetical protein BU26DRAFT_189288 [Trematosphaeria pertusa]